jgi:3-methyladenine DNA glycosylase AlkD
MFPTADALLARLREAGDPANVAGMARYGITTDNAFGVPMPVLRGIARELRADRKADPAGAHGLAQELWESGVHEGRILAPLVDVPSLVTREQARAWADDLDSWDVCDQLCSIGGASFAGW